MEFGCLVFGCLVLAFLLNVGDIYGDYKMQGSEDSLNMKEN